LGVLLWRLQVRSREPIREFFLWGVDYPFHFLLTATLVLVIWGVLGAGFGLQGLFLNEDPLTQVLLGATVMLLLATITVHYVALGTSRRGWWTALHGVTRLMRGVNAVADRSRPVQSVLANGFLERLTNADIKTIDRASRLSLASSKSGEANELPAAVSEQLESEAFRVLVAPAILLSKGFGLILLVGVVPTIVIPLVNRDPAGCLERLPWLVGVCVGDVIGIIIGCWTTSWAAEAAEWGNRKQTILATIREWAVTVETAQGGRNAGGDSSVAGAVVSPMPWWLSRLTAFFLIHAACTLLLPESVTTRWIDWPQGGGTDGWLGTVPWLPLVILLAEVGAASLLVSGLPHLPRLLSSDRFARLVAEGRSLYASVVTLTLRTLRARWVHRAAWLAAAGLGIASVLATILMSPEITSSVWLGLRGYASLGSMLLCWMVTFWLSTHAATGHGCRTQREQSAAIGGLCGLGALHVLAAPAWLVAPLAAAAAVISGSRSFAGLWQGDPYGTLRCTLAVCLAVAAGVTLSVGWMTGWFAEAAAAWLGVAMLFLGSTTLGGVATREPSLLYPATVLLGYFAFAIPYSALGERWQSAMPAAGSIAIAVALLAAVYTIIVFTRPRSAMLTTAALVATAVLLNGAALFVTPNEFKGTFPNMETYYRLPVYLDSRDYFRDTTPSTARLRNRAVTEDFDRMERQGANERLATVYFTMGPLRSRPDGSHAVLLTVEDPRGRLRAVVGDAIRLAAEEWFTIRIDGADCIALAEESFYRRIFPWFRYETLHMIRDGIIRGPTRPLVREGEPVAPRRLGMPALTSYRFITGDGSRTGPKDGDVLGLRLVGLADEYRRVDAEYALIAMNWRGLVTAVRHEPHGDVYSVEFEIPERGGQLDEQELRTMGSWMERCHLDTLRPAEPALAKDGDAYQRLQLLQTSNAPVGSCLVLEDVRSEAPVPAGVFLASEAAAHGRHPAFAPYALSPDAIRATIAATPAPVTSESPPHAADRFTLRLAHDRGLFASPDGAVGRSTGALAAPRHAESVTVALYNSGRLRAGDRLILTWNGRDGSASGPRLQHGAVFELLDVGRSMADAPAAESDAAYPLGAVWATLRPVDRHAAVVARDRDPGEEDDPFLVGQWQTVQLLNNTEVLMAWRSLVGDRWQGSKPKLVIVTVSGGGIRASVWTSVVLRKLEATLGSDFPYHIRLITGASGGMVGGSYYAMTLVPPPEGVLRGHRADFAQLHGTTIEDFVSRMATDQLDAVAGRMLFADLPGTLSPFAKKGDRGRTLEQTWIRWTGGPDSPLGRPLQSYAADERLGWRPTLIYTPMMVEDGRRLLISNLDLAFATRNVGGLLLEPSSRKIERPTIQGGDFDLSIHEEDDVFSLSAVEFFRLFPQAHDFQVTTAARMSASFPWVSPAINLPTLPPRRVVDAAYYDNYGVNLSSLWLSKMGSWLEENTSGVLVVQIRDNVSQGARTEIDFDRIKPEDSLLDRLVWHGGSRLVRPGLQAISTPLIGVTNARTWTMAFRNDEQVDLQDLLFDEKRGSDFFRTVVFECPVEVSLNWKLSDREKAVLIGGFGRPDATPREELSRVKDFMTGRDSYEFHKWRIDHRNDPTFLPQLKERYDEQLRALGIVGTDRLGVRESQKLYENVIRNLKRLELLADWWEAGRLDGEVSGKRPVGKLSGHADLHAP
jgi:hypothetical protein